MSIQKEIKEALEKATPGPWMRKDNEVWTVKTDRDDYHTLIAKKTKCTGYEHDINLIANAPTWLLHQQELIEQKDQFNTELCKQILELESIVKDKNAEIARINEARIGVTQTKNEIIAALHETKSRQAEGIKQLREQLERSKLTPMQKMSRSMDILSKLKKEESP